MHIDNLADRTAIVTGGGSGIGRSIAIHLAQAGARVAVTGRRADALDETVARVREHADVDAIAQVMDVCDERSVTLGIEAIAGRFGGRIDILVNNAGAGGPNACSTAGADRWREILATNLDGVFYCTREALRFMPDGGRVLSISSVLGKFGVPGYTAYCASKHGVIGFTKALALEVAPRQITVNAICPGWVETDMARSGMELLAQSMGTDYRQAREAALAAVPIGRILETDEIAGMVLYLAGPFAGGVTAQAFSICGGQVQSG